MIYVGMSLLHYSEREILGMTPRKFALMCETYAQANENKASRRNNDY